MPGVEANLSHQLVSLTVEISLEFNDADSSISRQKSRAGAYRRQLAALSERSLRLALGHY